MIKDKKHSIRKYCTSQNVLLIILTFSLFSFCKELEEGKVLRRSRSKFHTFPLIFINVLLLFTILLIKKKKSKSNFFLKKEQ